MVVEHLAELFPEMEEGYERIPWDVEGKYQVSRLAGAIECVFLNLFLHFYIAYKLLYNVSYMCIDSVCSGRVCC